MAKGEVVELPEGFLTPTQEAIANFVVGFVEVRNPKREEDAHAIGSGTLVRFGDRRGIITAAHVLDRLKRQAIYEFVVPFMQKRPHRLSIDAAHCEPVLFGPSRQEADGPDLACLVLSEPDARRFDPYRSFFNLDKRRDQILKHPEDVMTGVWQLAGMIEEMSKDADVQPRHERVKEFWCLMSEVGIPVPSERGGFDYFDCEVRAPAGEEIPKSFGGTSGGGLWHLLLKRNDGKVEVSSYFLSGVAYYEALGENRRAILCHGRKSIYDKMLQVLLAPVSGSS